MVFSIFPLCKEEKIIFAFEPDSDEACVHFQFQWEITVFFLLAQWDLSVLWICSFSSLWASKDPQQRCAQRNFSAVLTWEPLPWRRTQIPPGALAEAALYWWGNFAHLCPRQQQAACSCWHIHIIPINPNCSSSAFVRPKGRALSWIHLQSFCSLNEDKFLLSRKMVL